MSRAEIVAVANTIPTYPGSRADRASFVRQAEIQTACMRQRGFVWMPHFGVENLAPVPDGMSAEERAAWDLALGGSWKPQAGPYDWHYAGCMGLATHETGQDAHH